MERTAVIVGTGSYVPDNIVTNEDIIKKFEGKQFPDYRGNMLTAEQFIQAFASRVGYKQRRKLKNPEETTATMCVEASKRALQQAGIQPEELDLIVLSTDSPDFISPSTSARIQYELGAKNAGFFDINSACAGFTIAMANAWNFLKNDVSLKYALVLGGYGMSRYSDPNDIITEFMFADGAGAVVLKAMNNSPYGIQSASIQGDGKYWDYMGIYGCGTWKGTTPETLEKGLQYVKFLKPFPADINIQAWPPLIEKTLAKAGWKKEDLNKIFFTQVNLSVIEAVCDKMGLPRTISHNIMDVYGYTGSACVPMAMDDANQKGLLKNGDKIVICTSGGGAAFAAMTLIWGK